MTAGKAAALPSLRGWGITGVQVGQWGRGDVSVWVCALPWSAASRVHRHPLGRPLVWPRERGGWGSAVTGAHLMAPGSRRVCEWEKGRLTFMEPKACLWEIHRLPRRSHCEWGVSSQQIESAKGLSFQKFS